MAFTDFGVAQVGSPLRFIFTVFSWGPTGSHGFHGLTAPCSVTVGPILHSQPTRPKRRRKLLLPWAVGHRVCHRTPFAIGDKQPLRHHAALARVRA